MAYNIIFIDNRGKPNQLTWFINISGRDTYLIQLYEQLKMKGYVQEKEYTSHCYRTLGDGSVSFAIRLPN